YQTNIMMLTLVLLVVVVQIFQEVGFRAATRGDRRKS
ncbi:MAG TPA: methionine ABC transporter permease, partial [Ruminococcaceae bacterium]|nr:methionine ABC transporter permease [Oscillospiraceae bacterium]HBN82073.1 methionine ABC transporter permease [Oscillospiraceae bacterium]